MHFLAQIALSGIATGAIYGLVAVGYSLTYSTMRMLNFALGMWVMLGAMLGYSLQVTLGVNVVVAFAGVMAALAVLGVVAERFTVLPFLRAGSDVWVMSTLAVGLLFIDFAELVWGRNPLSVPPLLEVSPSHFAACHYAGHAPEFRERARDAATWRTA